MKAPWRSQNGMAVIMALSVILLMVTAALELHLNERANLTSAAVFRDRQTLEQMTRAGIHMAMAILIKDRLESETDSLQEDWANPEAIAAWLAEIPFEQGDLEIGIVDEMGKIQVNALVQFPAGREFNPVQHQLWSQFAGGLIALEEEENDDLADPPDPIGIINSVKDWLDSGDDDAITGLSGAETDYYESLDPPYACKNAPFDHLDELRLVKGITPELFSGIGGSTGLSTYVTVFGATDSGDQKFSFPGQVNINTAELPVLAALLPPESIEFAPLLVQYRIDSSGTQFTHDLNQPNWYQNVPGLAGTTLDSKLITHASHIFRITASASLNEVHMTTTAVVERVKPSETASWKCKVLNWQRN